MERRDAHTFSVRVWLDEPADSRHQAAWRGHIMHLPSGERRYFADLEQITRFVAAYLERMA